VPSDTLLISVALYIVVPVIIAQWWRRADHDAEGWSLLQIGLSILVKLLRLVTDDSPGIFSL
jgi:ACR3 family arsenite efflux pump ArsB